MTDLVKNLFEQARKLTADERAQLIGQLWETLPPETGSLPIPGWHLLGLEQRLAEHESDPAAVVPWEQAKARLAARQRP